MASFASPLFWQIRFLVQSITKKNLKTNTAELQQVCRACTSLPACVAVVLTAGLGALAAL